MSRSLVYLHTVSSLVTIFAELSRELLPPDIEVFHIVDEMLLKLTLAKGELTPFIYRRVAEHAGAAEEAGAAALQITCSSISPCADVAQQMVGLPVLKVDEPMVDRAIADGRRIGLAATLPSTLHPTAELIKARAAATGKHISLESILCEGAYAALIAGDTEMHDRIVRQSVQGLASRSDVVILAQASMARVMANAEVAETRVPILTSPRLAVERAAQVLLDMRGTVPKTRG